MPCSLSLSGDSVSSSPGADKLWPTGQICPTILFLQIKFIGTQSHPFIVLSSLATLTLNSRIAHLHWRCRDQMACTTKNIYCLALYRKGFPIPVQAIHRTGIPWNPYLRDTPVRRQRLVVLALLVMNLLNFTQLLCCHISFPLALNYCLSTIYPLLKIKIWLPCVIVLSFHLSHTINHQGCIHSQATQLSNLLIPTPTRLV